MPQGLEVFNAAGAKIFTTTGMTFRYLGQLDITAGINEQPVFTVTDGGFLTGTPVAFFNGGRVNYPYWARQPSWTFSGSLMTVTYPVDNRNQQTNIGLSQPGATGTIYYGVR